MLGEMKSVSALQTLIKHSFLLFFPYELLMSIITAYVYKNG